MGKERLTNEYSEIPESGTTDSKVLNIRDVYVRSDMHDRAIEQKCGNTPDQLTSLMDSRINVEQLKLTCRTFFFWLLF